MSVAPPDLPDAVVTFVRAVNAGELEALVEAFADHALVNDQLREHWDKPAIAEWATRELIEQRLRMSVERAVTNHEHTVITAVVDGDFDKRGLPEPLLVTFYFSTRENRIVQLLIQRNEPSG